MKRTLEVTLSDGNKYTMSERTRRDSDYQFYQNALRRDNLRTIQDTIVSQDIQLSLLMAEMKRVYTADELRQFMHCSSEFQYECLLNAFSEHHPDMTVKQLEILVPREEVRFLLQKLALLEADDDEQISVGEKKKRR